MQQSCGSMENTTGNGFAAFHSLPAVFPNFHAEADADFHRCGWRQKSNGIRDVSKLLSTSTTPLLYGVSRRMPVKQAFAALYVFHFNKHGFARQ